MGRRFSGLDIPDTVADDIMSWGEPSPDAMCMAGHDEDSIRAERHDGPPVSYVRIPKPRSRDCAVCNLRLHPSDQTPCDEPNCPIRRQAILR